jgi:hypothetical protein
MIVVRGAFLLMLTMSLLGAVLTLFLQQTGGALAGAFATYLILTSWMTVRPRHQVGYFEFFALLVALCLVAGGVDVGLTATGIDATCGFLLAGAAAIAASGDLILLIRRVSRGRQRIARHLWRLGTAVLIATGSFATAGGSLVHFLVELSVLMSLILWIIHLQISSSAR